MKFFIFELNNTMPKTWTREEYHMTKGKKVFWKEDCPFCDLEANKERIIWRGKHWFFIQNKYPYSGEENHIMLVPFQHILYSYELQTEQTQELVEAYKFVKEFFWEQMYFSCTRETIDNRSVEHFHMHFLPWRLQWKYIRNMLMNQGFPVVQNLD